MDIENSTNQFPVEFVTQAFRTNKGENMNIDLDSVDDFVMTKDKEPKIIKTLFQNVRVAFKKLGVELRRSEFNNRVFVARIGKHVKGLSDGPMSLPVLREIIQNEFGVTFTEKLMRDTMSNIARENDI